MNNRRLLLTLLLLVLTLAACRQEQPSTEPDDQPSGEETEQGDADGATGGPVATSEPPAATATPSDPLAQIDPSGQTLTLVHVYDGATTEALDSLVASFNESNEHGITIEVADSDPDAEPVPLEERVSAAEAHLLIAPAPPPALSDNLLDMGSYATSATWGDTSATPEHPLTTIPLAWATEALYYNADLMAELGIDAPPATWQELTDAACQAGERIGFVYPYELATGEPSHSAALVASRGGTIADGDTLSLDNEVARTTFADLQGLYQEGCIGPVVERQLIAENFGAGNILFVADSSRHAATYESAVVEGYGGEWGIAPLPLDEGGQLLINGVVLAVFSGSDEQQLASWLFAQWLQAPEQRAILAEATALIVPGSESGTLLNAALGESGQLDPTAPFSDDVRAIIEEGTAQIVDQGADVELTLTDLTSEVQHWIAER